VRFYQTTDIGVVTLYQKSVYAVDGATGDILCAPQDVSDFDENDVSAGAGVSDLLLLEFLKKENARVLKQLTLDGNRIWRSDKSKAA